MEQLKPMALGAVGGAILMSIIGFAGFGWHTAGGANTLAEDRSEAAVTEALTPVCVAQAQSDPEFETKFAAINEESSYRQRSALADAGWATVPGASSSNRDLAEACLEALQDNAS